MTSYAYCQGLPNVQKLLCQGKTQVDQTTIDSSNPSCKDGPERSPYNRLTIPRNAAIGAEAGRSSFAYYLQRYTSHAHNLTIFDKNGYAAGRSVTVGKYAASMGPGPYPDTVQSTESVVFDESVYESDVKLGESIIVSADKILRHTVEGFGLETSL